MTQSSSLKQHAIKICGVRDAEVARVAVEAGADLLGFMLAPSRRRVTPEQVRDVLVETKPATVGVRAVGVFVNEPVDAIHQVIETSGLDLVQLSGDEPVSSLDDLDVPVIKALRIPPGTSLDEARRMFEGWLSHSRPPIAFLFDAHVAGSFGGTGIVADWNLATQLAERFPVVLAGGLDPLNVDGAITSVQPAGVDVSSGVETDGVKDERKIRAFIAAAQRSFASSARAAG